MHVFGQVLFHHLHTLMYGISNVNVVGAGLWNNYHTHHGHTVHLHIALDITRRKFCTSDIAETHNSAILLLDHQVVEFFCRMHLAHGTDG